MYLANSERYQSFQYRKIKNSGLVLPPLSLGCWHNFGDDTPIQQQNRCFTRRLIMELIILIWPIIMEHPMEVQRKILGTF